MQQRFLLHRPGAPLPPSVLTEMHRVRSAVFRDRLGWEVNSRDGLERDCYDLVGPVYGICQSDAGAILGCWRLLPTTGPYMLRDIFPELIGEHEMPRSPRVWEISRFALSERNRAFCTGRMLQQATVQLLAGLIECALDFDLERIVAVTDLRFEKILQRGGLDTHRFCEPRPVDGTPSTAGWIDIDERALARVRAALNESAEPLPRHTVAA